MSDQADIDAWIAEDDTVPEIQSRNTDRQVLRLVRLVKIAAARLKTLEDRVAALEARIGK